MRNFTGCTQELVVKTTKEDQSIKTPLQKMINFVRFNVRMKCECVRAYMRECICVCVEGGEGRYIHVRACLHVCVYLSAVFVPVCHCVRHMTFSSCVFERLPVCPSVCLSVCLPVCLSHCLLTF